MKPFMIRCSPKASALALICFLFFLLVGPSFAPGQLKQGRVAGTTRKVNFKRDIQPLFRRHCYRCHGPRKAKGRLRLSSRKTVLDKADPKDGLIVPGKPEKSYLLERLTNPEMGDLMPLDSKRLSKKEVALLQRWIREGAYWPDDLAEDRHWAYVEVQRPALPQLRNKDWPINPIDSFVLARLEEEGLTPAPPAQRARLLRRVSLALTGTPPTIQEVDDFVADTSPEAYEKAVDRLLHSKRYGERWAQHWLDLARYADSNGFQADQLRDSWAYRDWVIAAFNRDMPFNQFTIEQLAGDLLPKPTVEQKIATGFHRTTTCNVEAGVHPEANRVNQIFDRVNTTGTVFLGATLECAQCHDHKYDPFTQKDYYGLFAYFNNTPLEVEGKGGVQFDFVGPKMPLPLTAEQRARKTRLQAELAQLQKQQQSLRKQQQSNFADWQRQVRAALKTHPVSWKTLHPKTFTSNGGEDFQTLEDGSILLDGSVPGTAIYTLRFQGPLHDVVGIKVETLTHESLPGKGPGRGDDNRPNFVLSELTVQIAREGKPVRETIPLHSAHASFSQRRWEVAKAIDGNRRTGWGIAPQFHKPHWASFRTQKPLQLGENESLVVQLDQNLGRGRTIGRVRISVLVGDPKTADLPDTIRAILKKNKLTNKEKARLRAFHASANPELQKLTRQIKQLQKSLKSTPSPTTLVMVEMPKKRMTHILNRGDYLDKGDRVKAGTPSALHPLEPSLPRNRLGLARWLVSRENPLLPRVTVNRWWAELFGQGIVSTLEDFGTQGETPTHPELLDWLAVEFMERGWSMKRVHKLMVMSATFRQSARLTPALARRDPGNRLYARGPRFRLPAESVRDNALAISGLLASKMYGPPIMPYQPSGIWKAVGRNQPTWVTAQNEDRFRRGVYVVWKRGAPYPSFVNFDAPDRAACTVKRPRTNTPLQALTLMNDPAYAELALALAQRMMEESPASTPESRATWGFRLCLSRKPSPREIEILVRLYAMELKKVRSQPNLVKRRLDNLLPRLRNEKLNSTELAAWFAVANVLLNLDETISL